MLKTRPSGSPILEGESATVSQEIAEIDERGRIHFLQRWTKKISWLHDLSSIEKETLAILIEPGRVSFRDWEPEGPRIIERYKELEGDTDNFEVLRLLQDRYQRLIISKDRRPYLGDAILTHLGLPTSRIAKSPVYISVFPDKIDVLSRGYRDQALIVGHPAINDLP